jgi:hypothetical protein
VAGSGAVTTKPAILTSTAPTPIAFQVNSGNSWITPGFLLNRVERGVVLGPARSPLILQAEFSLMPDIHQNQTNYLLGAEILTVQALITTIRSCERLSSASPEACCWPA